ncbi:hypothetical protein LK542_08000 [Massilia sp. IC2-477]|uniref:hypothetical protein n=1 Tax=unclassified Massilia TaxID=2609279 RepID=UPI001D1015B1|nr:MULTISPECIES: hypothetical protein [unclassified Massilia]MCC2955551.1 hypothetical protein [Massilia sp. IC2-477]MCC2974423.1 hypothetical protein [Massilia sp. IC2-476]
MDKEQAKRGAATQEDSKASQGGLWQYQVPAQDPGAGAVQSNAGHYTGGAHGGDSQQGDFLPSPPDANAMPAGAAQTSRGSAGRSETGGGGGGGGDTGSGSAGGSQGGAGGGNLGGAGAGAGKTPGTPGGNGTPDEPIWGS